ncbi:hypothetical protein MKZ38_000151 [Zalerion maritima]|uniref:Uncharacterized protein n=1 Tax=Zalerion maritima TaxID=339359 RepID=A0AAD5WMR5_9PEZI|nr:hypothetical protein MKZ38_000151 [Zalerion maritima]
MESTASCWFDVSLLRGGATHLTGSEVCLASSGDPFGVGGLVFKSSVAGNCGVPGRPNGCWTYMLALPFLDVTVENPQGNWEALVLLKLDRPYCSEISSILVHDDMSTSSSFVYPKQGGGTSSSKKDKSLKHRHQQAPKSKPETKQRSKASGISGPSFFFVINELIIEFSQCTVQPVTGSEIPPPLHTGYTETPGPVFHYSNGTIQAAPNYLWYRPGGPGNPGFITGYQRDQNNNYLLDEAGQFLMDDGFSTFHNYAVFDCWRLLPRIFSWGDPLDATQLISWHLVHFIKHESFPGASVVGHAGQRYTTGRNPPRILPDVFHNTYANQPPCGGLLGDLGLLLGLMALTLPVGSTHRVKEYWSGPGHSWRGHSTADILPEETPRGVLVHIAIDPFNPTYSTDSELKGLGNENIVVRAS